MNPFGGTYYAAAEAIPGISSGQLHIVGSVVRHAAGPLKGKIHSYLQETSLVADLLESVQASGSTLMRTTVATGNPALGVAASATQLVSSVGSNVQNEFIRQGVKRVPSLATSFRTGSVALP